MMKQGHTEYDIPVGEDYAIRHAKAKVRAEVLEARRALPPKEKAKCDAARYRRLSRQLRTIQPLCVAAYVSRDEEPDTWALMWELAEAGVEILLPALPPDSRDMTPLWSSWHGEEFGMPILGIPQPTSMAQSGDILSIADVIVLPGLAGTITGARLGRGGGWYDRALTFANLDTPRWLLLNDSEVLPQVPTEAHDLKVTSIITESRWIGCTG